MATKTQKEPLEALKKEVLLQINERLFKAGVISEELYKEAKIKIVSTT